MVTTTRRSSEISSTYEPARGGVDLLEKPRSYEEYASVAPASPATEEDFSEEKAKRQSNLEKLLNYDRYAEQMSAPTASVETKVETEKAALAEEDIRPTSTTMQFGDDIDQIRREMNRAQEQTHEESYHLNKRGKLVVTLYALVVTVILALIVLNTGVLANLSAQSANKAAQLEATVARYEAIQDELEAMTDADYIIDIAQNQYGMVKQ